MKKYLFNIFLVLILLIGIGLLAYPTLSNYINNLHQSRAVATYVEKTKDLSKEQNEKFLKEAKQYNQTLLKKNNRYLMSSSEEDEYKKILDVTGTGIMAYVEIPKIDVLLPIYHGTDEAVLQIAIGHVPGSSLPVGGKSTHSVISGHRGLPSAKLFTDLDKLEKGDIFFINVLDETLAYKVDMIDIINPDEIEKLEIEEGKDYCTLVTCTPYGVNSHRLIVRGHRTDYEKKGNTVEKIQEKANKTIMIILASIVFLIVAIIILIIRKRKIRRTL
ncbi:TPA: class C sortase [Clostridium perfringens]|nr:class C sortase [Clostridium perfringens]